MYTKQETKALLQLGATIRKKRVELSMSQAQLAFELGTDGRHVRRIEKGEINPSYLTVKKIAEIFDVSIDTLSYEKP